MYCEKCGCEVKLPNYTIIPINNLSDEKSKRVLLSKAADVCDNGGKVHIVE